VKKYWPPPDIEENGMRKTMDVFKSSFMNPILK